MDFLHVLTTSNIQSSVSEKFLGAFEDKEAARDAGLWWSIDNNHTSDISWHSSDNLDTAQIGEQTWLHIKTVKANRLID